MSYKDIGILKKLIWKVCCTCCATSWRWRNRATRKKMSSWQVLGGRKETWQSMEDFWCRASALCDRYRNAASGTMSSSKFTSCVMLTVNLRESYRLGVEMVSQYRFMNCGKHIRQVWALMANKATWDRAGSVWKMQLPFNFYTNLKQLWKKTSS